MPKYDPTQDPESLMRTHDAGAMIGISAFTLRRWRLNGTGPRVITLTANRVGYRRRDLMSWIAERESS